MLNRVVFGPFCTHIEAMPQDQFAIRNGFEPAQREKVCALFWQAFQEKLRIPMGPEVKALAFLQRIADPSHAISCVDNDGNLLGVAGFKTKDGALFDGSWNDLRNIYGTLSGLLRVPLLTLLSRPLKDDTLLMDGIFVTPEAQGRGLGTALLNAIKAEAKKRDLRFVRLDVIDTNPRARALYERQGFIAGETTDLGPLRHIFGFRRATTMTLEV